MTKLVLEAIPLMTIALMALLPNQAKAQVRVTITVESADELSNPNGVDVVIGEPDARTEDAQPPSAPTSAPPTSVPPTSAPTTGYRAAPRWAEQPALPPGYAPQGYAPRYPPLANAPINPEAERLRLEIRSIRLGGSIAMIPIGFGLAGMLSYATALSAVLCYGDCTAPLVLGIMSAGALALGIAGIVRLASRKRRRNRLRSQLRAMDAAVIRW